VIPLVAQDTRGDGSGEGEKTEGQEVNIKRSLAKLNLAELREAADYIAARDARLEDKPIPDPALFRTKAAEREYWQAVGLIKRISMTQLQRLWSDIKYRRRSLAEDESYVEKLEYRTEELQRLYSPLRRRPHSNEAERTQAFRKLAKALHPDTRDGDTELMKALNVLGG
jgi:hypothetical protein